MIARSPNQHILREYSVTTADEVRTFCDRRENFADELKSAVNRELALGCICVHRNNRHLIFSCIR